MSKSNQQQKFKIDQNLLITNVIRWASLEFKIEFDHYQLEKTIRKNPLLLNHLLTYLVEKFRKNDLKIQQILLQKQIQNNNDFFRTKIEDDKNPIRNIEISIKEFGKLVDYIDDDDGNDSIQRPDLLPPPSPSLSLSNIKHLDYSKFETINNDIDNQLKIIINTIDNDDHQIIINYKENIAEICKSFQKIIDNINDKIREIFHKNSNEKNELSTIATTTNLLPPNTISSDIINPLSDLYNHLNRLKIIMDEWNRKLDNNFAN